MCSYTKGAIGNREKITDGIGMDLIVSFGYLLLKGRLAAATILKPGKKDAIS